MNPNSSIALDLLMLEYCMFNFTTMGSFWDFVLFYLKILSSMYLHFYLVYFVIGMSCHDLVANKIF